MAKVSPLTCYQLFTAIKTHFNSDSYDFFRYKGKLKYTTEENFLKRNDRYHYTKLANKYQFEDLIDLIASNVVHNPKIWIGNLNPDLLVEMRKNEESRDYILTNTWNDLFNEAGQPMNLIIRSEDGDVPFLLHRYYQNEIDLDTFIITMDVLPEGVYGYFDKHLEHNMLWKETKRKALKYQPFLHYDKKKCRKIFNESLKKFG